MKLKQLGSNKTQVTYDLHTGKMDVLFSYETPVAAWLPNRGYIRTNQKFSVTTTKHINQWLQGAEAYEVPQSQLEELVQ